MPIDDESLLGAQQIIQHCLGLNRGQDLVIFFDESTIEVGLVLSETADRLGIPTTPILVPIILQRRIPDEGDLSLLAQGVAKEARAILTCVTGLPDCLRFRERILEAHWSARTRIGHMPGANIDLLKLANIDFEQLIADCHHLELTLARGKNLKFMSYAHDGTIHTLKADIGSWGRLPVASDGVIADGVWGNVPSGETYIAPIEGSGEGSIVINGSVPGQVIKFGEEITVFFRQGRLTHIQPEDSPTALHLYQTQIQPSVSKGDENWRNLAEIGIGVNPAVKNMTGNMLFDEKAAGTAHIALGSNTFMGGNLDAAIHCDLVVKAPTIMIDGKIILDQGNLHFVESEWLENYAEIALDTSPLCDAMAVSRSGSQSGSNVHRLQRTLRPEPGRVSEVFIGDVETSQLAHLLYDLLPEDGDWIDLKSLQVYSGLAEETIRRVLHIMWDFGLLNIRR